MNLLDFWTKDFLKCRSSNTVEVVTRQEMSLNVALPSLKMGKNVSVYIGFKIL